MDIGDAVPSLELVDTELKPVDLSLVTKGKPTLIAFFPGAFTGTCTKEMCHLRDDMSQLNSMNTKVYAISVDGPFANKEFKAKNGISFDILSDYKKEAIKAFGVELMDFAHIKGYTAAKRSVFITDANGIIKFKWVSDDPTVEPDYEKVKSALRSITG